MGLVVSDLSKKYGNKTVVNHISFEIPKPGVYALLGTNGAGKNYNYKDDAWNAVKGQWRSFMER